MIHLLVASEIAEVFLLFGLGQYSNSESESEYLNSSFCSFSFLVFLLFFLHQPYWLTLNQYLYFHLNFFSFFLFLSFLWIWSGDLILFGILLIILCRLNNKQSLILIIRFIHRNSLNFILKSIFNWKMLW